MKDRIFKIVGQVMDIPVEQVNKDSSPDSVENWDSLKHMNLILALEEEFGITFSDQEIVEMLSLEIIIAIMKEKLGEAPEKK